VICFHIKFHMRNFNQSISYLLVTSIKSKAKHIDSMQPDFVLHSTENRLSRSCMCFEDLLNASYQDS
jgi:hypothetical protein